MKVELCVCLCMCCLYYYKGWVVPFVALSVLIERLGCAFVCDVCIIIKVGLCLFVCHL